MKLLILIALTFSLSTIAGVGDSSGGSSNGKISLNNEWKEIKLMVKKDRKLKITGGNAFVGRTVSIFDVCTKGDSLNTNKKFNIYVRKYVGKSRDTDNERDGYMNVLKEKRILTYPLHAIHSQRECNNHGKNCHDVPVDFIQDTQKTLSVKKFLRKEGSEDREVYKTILKKEYSIPGCSK